MSDLDRAADNGYGVYVECRTHNFKPTGFVVKRDGTIQQMFSCTNCWHEEERQVSRGVGQVRRNRAY